MSTITANPTQTGMTFEKTEQQKAIIEMVSKFAETHIRPNIMEWDEAQTYPVETMKKLGEQGLMGMLVPEEYGGSGMGYMEYIAAIIELGRVDPSIGLSMAAHNSLCTNHILMYGNDAQKQQYLPKLATGEFIGAWGLTEPNTGSDAGNMQTVAEKDGDHWVINGMKNFITHGISGDVAVVVCRTGEPNTSGNATAFVIEYGTEGFRGGKKEDKLGMRASETAQLLFDNVRIPDSQRLGEVGDGFRQAMGVLDGGRISIAALSIGLAHGCLDACLQYSKEREQFGKPINRFQAIAFKIADMATEIENSELLTYKAGDQKNRGESVTVSGAMAKWYASEACVRAATEAVQIFGGYGFVKDYPVEKFFRDCKLCTIGEGTSEIQQLVISRNLLKE